MRSQWIYKSLKLLVLTTTVTCSMVACRDNTGITKNVQSPDPTVKFSKLGDSVLPLMVMENNSSPSNKVIAQVNAANISEIPIFTVFEQALTHAGKYANPYTEVEATATFTDPNGQNKTIPLFWDGGNTWKMRFSPNTKGTWKWSVRSKDAGLNGKTGSFKTIEGNTKGSIQVNPKYPHHFQYQDGTPFWLFGETNWRIFSSDETEKLNRETVKIYINKRAEQGFNFIHGTLMSRRGNEGGLPFNNLTEETLNPGYWQEVDSRVKYLNKKGITAMLILAWAHGNNIADWKAFASDEARYRYARYIAARYSAFNTAFNVAGEWDEFGSRSLYQNIAQEIVKADPHQRLIGIHPGEKSHSVAEFAEEDWMSFSDYQQNYNNLYERILEVRKFNKPAINSEYAYYLRDANGDGKVDKPNSSTLDEIRHASWDIVMGGGYFVTGWGTTCLGGYRDPGPFNVNDPKNRDWEEQVQHLPKLFKTLEWWKLQPISDRLNGKGTHYLLGEENQQYVVYVRNTKEPLTLTLKTENPTTYRVQLYNPRLGEFSNLPNVKESQSITLEPPTDKDWVFVITKN